MKIKDVCKIIIDAIYSSCSRCRAGRYDGKIAILPDGYRLFLIDEKDCFFDIEKINRGQPEFNVSSAINLDRDYKIGVLAEIITIKGVSKAKLVNGDDFVYVNHKFLKVFDKSAVYKFTNEIQPVLVYEFDKLVGLIMPIKK